MALHSISTERRARKNLEYCSAHFLNESPHHYSCPQICLVSINNKATNQQEEGREGGKEEERKEGKRKEEKGEGWKEKRERLM